MPKHLYLRRPPIAQIGGGVLLTVVTYVIAVWIDTVSEDTTGARAVTAQALHDLLLAASAFAFGAVGIAGWLRWWRARQMSHQTGATLLSLLADVDHMAGRLISLVWEPARATLSQWDDLGSDDVWRLLKQGEQGQTEVLHRHMAALGALQEGTPRQERMAEAQEQLASDAQWIAETAIVLHERALELSEYRSASAEKLVAATVDCRSIAAEWLEDSRSVSSPGAASPFQLMALPIQLSDSLIAIGEAVAVTERETEAAMARTPEGRDLLKKHAEDKASRREFTDAALEIARQSREMGEMLAEMDRQRAALEELVDRMRTGT